MQIDREAVDSPALTEATPQSMSPVVELAPIATAQRIDAMDVLRGFALIGILMMNIEWFNRPIAELGGFDRTLAGADFAVGWFIRVFIEGKFYKLFSLLFGMGFAVMLLRAREAGKPFTGWFTRRMLVLFAFGLIHLVFFWGGDILHDYAFGGLLLLGWILLLQKPKLQRLADPRKFLQIGLTMLALPFVVMMAVGVWFGMTRDFGQLNAEWDEQQKVEMLSREPASKGVATDGAAAGATTATGVPPAAQTSQHADRSTDTGDKLAAAATVESAATTTTNPSAAEAADNTAKVDDEEDAAEVDESTLSPAERIAHRADKKRKQRLKREQDAAEERTAFSQPSYWQATAYRAKSALHHLGDTPFFGVIILFPLFLVGYWFVASGVMRDPKRHSLLFKSMAWIGLILGVAMSLVGIMLGAHPASRVSNQIGFLGGSVFTLGQYVLAAGYLGLIVEMVQSERWRPRLAVLAPLGRMALTNYLSHSLILSMLFYGYGAGLFGQVPRATQMLFVIAIIALQIIVSKWWLNRFQFGPMEWLWRSLTYLKRQPMRIATR